MNVITPVPTNKTSRLHPSTAGSQETKIPALQTHHGSHALPSVERQKLLSAVSTPKTAMQAVGPQVPAAFGWAPEAG